MPGCSGGLVVTNARVTNYHARLRVHRAPGIPHALFEGEPNRHDFGRIAPRERESLPAGMRLFETYHISRLNNDSSCAGLTRASIQKHLESR
jgi:hypothetical protein